MELVTFGVGGEEYAVDLSIVEEVIPGRGVEAGSASSGSLRGSVRWRDRRVPVVDLGRWFGVGEHDPQTARVVVVRDAEREVGLLVDEVAEVTPAAEDEILPLPAWFSGAPLLGVIPRDERMIVLLDLHRLLERPEAQPVGAGEPEDA